MQKIADMSQEEILEAQKQILQQLGASHINALNKFKNNFGKGVKKPNAAATKKKSSQPMQIDYEQEEVKTD